MARAQVRRHGRKEEAEAGGGRGRRNATEEAKSNVRLKRNGKNKYSLAVGTRAC